MIKHRDEKDTLDFTANDKLNNFGQIIKFIFIWSFLWLK